MTSEHCYSDGLRSLSHEERVMAIVEDGSLLDAVLDEAEFIAAQNGRNFALVKRLGEALAAIANSEIPGVSGGPNGPSAQVMEFAANALAGDEVTRS